MGLNYHASSPTVVLAPQQSNSYLSSLQRAHSPMSRFRPKHPVPPSLNYQAAVSNAAAGRKRNITDVDDAEENAPSGTTPAKPRAEPTYGPGMTLVYPDQPGWSIPAESQTGTWCEEKQTQQEKAQPVRPMARSRKSQRMDSATDVSISPLNDIAVDQPAENVIDDKGNTIESLITSLGIGWKNVMTNPTLRDASRAYARVIENHFDLTEVQLMLEKESLNAYLVRAKQHGVQGYWLFADSLKWCQLVGWSLQRTIANLTHGPIPHVEGEVICARDRTPSAEPSTPSNAFAGSALDDDAMQM